MDHDQIKFDLSEGLEKLFYAKLNELQQEDSHFFEKDIEIQMAYIQKEMYSDLSNWVDWEWKNAQANYFKLTGEH